MYACTSVSAYTHMHAFLHVLYQTPMYTCIHCTDKITHNCETLASHLFQNWLTTITKQWLYALVRVNCNSKWKSTELNKEQLHLRKQYMSTEFQTKITPPSFASFTSTSHSKQDITKMYTPMDQVQNSGNVKKDNIQRCCYRTTCKTGSKHC